MQTLPPPTGGATRRPGTSGPGRECAASRMLLIPVVLVPFGTRLRQWRAARGVSQLALAGRIGSTSRHVSFLETGRSRPSAAMVLRLGEALDLPLRERNELLHAAGLAAEFPEASLGSVDLAPFRAAIDSLLTARLPYPAMVLDRHWNVLMANAACDRLYGDGLAGPTSCAGS